MQARREGGVGRLATPGPATFGGPYRRLEIQSTPECAILKSKIQKFSSQRGPVKMFGAPRECFPGPRCGSRRAWLNRAARQCFFGFLLTLIAGCLRSVFQFCALF